MPISLAPLVAAVDFSSTIAAILGVGAVLALLYVAIKAAQIVLTLLSGRVYFGGQSWSKEEYQQALGLVKREVRSGRLVDAESRQALKDYESTTRNRSRSNRW